ncbi:unnamed protein product, partial [Lymnaea stagnalis]
MGKAHRPYVFVYGATNFITSPTYTVTPEVKKKKKKKTVYEQIIGMTGSSLNLPQLAREASISVVVSENDDAQMLTQIASESDTVTVTTNGEVKDSDFESHNASVQNNIIKREGSDVFDSDSNILTQWIYKNNLDRVIKCFESESDPLRAEALIAVNSRDDFGKTPLDVVACLGQTDVVRLLIEKGGADVNSCNSKGYTALHFAAAWGRISVLKVLVEKGGNLQLINVFNERPRETALRYNQVECVEFIDLSEAKILLQEAIAVAEDAIYDPVDKTALSRLTREEKYTVVNACKEKQEWLENNKQAVVRDYVAQRLSLCETVNPILNKIAESSKCGYDPIRLLNNHI